MRTQDTIKSALLFLAASVAFFAMPASAQLGGPIDGLSAEELALFDEGRLMFEREFTPGEGLGPLYNFASCAGCHGAPATGGSDPEVTANNVMHFGIRDQGRFFEAHEIGGPVRQRLSVAGAPGAETCELPPETPEFIVPFVPGAFTSMRNTPPVFGFGLIDAIPDHRLTRRMGKKPGKAPGVFGTPNWGVEMEGLGRALSFTLDPNGRTAPKGPGRVGRFGWKAQTATLWQFTTEPMNVELGLTSPFFPRENTPGLDPLPPECDPLEGIDDPTNEIGLPLFYFQAFVAPPERGEVGFRERIGEVVFNAIGCNDCHVKRQRTARDYYVPWPDGSAHRVDALSNKTFYPWSDFLLHDMGAENDDQRNMALAGGRLWRTTPLWGMRHKTALWHDGSAMTYEDAIDKHAGEGSWSRAAYEALPEFLKSWVLKFLDSL